MNSIFKRKSLFYRYLIFSSILLCSTISKAQFKFSRGYLRIPDTNVVNEKFTFGNLKILPIYVGKRFLNEQEPTYKEFISLKDALEKNKIIISEIDEKHERHSAPRHNTVIKKNLFTEISHQKITVQENNHLNARVNTIFCQNISQDTIVFLAGEVIKGGKQDRVVARDHFIPPGPVKHDISVYCIEKNRWKPEYNSILFHEYFSIASSSIRRILTIDKDQERLWEEVNHVLNRNGATNLGEAYSELGNSSYYNSKLDMYNHFFKRSFLEETNCIGLLAISGNKIIGMDVFGTPEVFHTYQKTILEGYITEAITNGSIPHHSFESIDYFLEQYFNKSGFKEDEIKKRGTVVHYEGKIYHISAF